MDRVKIIEAQWRESTNTIMCQIDTKLITSTNNRDLIYLGPEAFGLDVDNVTPEQQKLLSEIASLLPGKYINIEDGSTELSD